MPGAVDAVGGRYITMDEKKNGFPCGEKTQCKLSCGFFPEIPVFLKLPTLRHVISGITQ